MMVKHALTPGGQRRRRNKRLIRHPAKKEPELEDRVLPQVSSLELASSTKATTGFDEHREIAEGLASAELAAADRLEDSLDLYLQEISQFNLLDAERETELSGCIRAAFAAKHRLSEPGLKDDEKMLLEEFIKRGEAAREEMINANLRLVITIAKQYKRCNKSLALPDLIQEGNRGLMLAVDKYDYRLGHRFSTYAVWWIRQTISRSIGKTSRTIRLPSYLVEDLSKLYRLRDHLRQKFACEPTSAQLAASMGETWDETRVNALMQLAREPISLERPISENTVFADFITDETQVGPANHTEQLALAELIETAFQHLSERERQILKLRLGFINHQEHSLAAIGRHYGITRERVRQLESRALRKLRLAKLSGLKAFYDDL